MTFKTKEDLLKYQERHGTKGLERTLSSFLTYEINDWRDVRIEGATFVSVKEITDEHNRYKEQIGFFKELFDWEESYSVNYKWEMEPSIAYSDIDCDTRSKAVELLEGKEPDGFDEWEEGDQYEIDEEGKEIERQLKRRGYVGVSNLRFKDGTQLIVSKEAANEE